MKRNLQNWLSTGIFLVIVLAIAYTIINIIMQKTVIEGDSMSPVLDDGDVVFTNIVTYNFNPPQIGDVVLIELKDGTRIVKRIGADQGKYVKIDSFGRLIVNDNVVQNDHGVGIIMEPGIAHESIHLGPEEYFVLGDNRNHSKDSRDPKIGVIKRSQLVGKVFYRIQPFEKMGAIE